MEAGLASAGMDVVMLGPLPTPAIAYLTQTARAHAGVVISASHNHYSDNGIKFFSPIGTKISDELQDEIEALMQQDIKVVPSEQLGKPTEWTMLWAVMSNFVKARYLDEWISKA